KFPRSGRVVPEVGHRSLREIIDPPYRIVYRVASDDTVEVVTVFRTSRRFPDVVE
ncbi:MAG TPA: type II toxin-antitoxin system RelE/ParE family toxin, partial [Planctomycetota bacterium]|nr:type II toxin-antitoxin system RelE/ParE family toxin [Planctomycetota bacterium]